jgi:glycosyltransferase involved in cell wall biosynthesis
MWEVLQQHIQKLKIVVWVHGAEIHPWYRREYNYTNEQEREAAKAESEVRMAFWRGLLSNPPQNLKLVFVSRYFAEEVMEDLGFRLPEDVYTIIHNPIDTDIFTYNQKNTAQRKKILSIRPYASRQYANDLSVEAILKLSKKPFFSDISFRIIGDGKLFTETLEPIKNFPNVTIERRFLTQREITDLHKEYGVFLCPTRWDSQGVSRDEAMSSGLVPITNKVAAIPEFVDEQTGMLAMAENSEEIADAISEIYNNAEKFTRISSSAANSVRQNRDTKNIISMEIKEIE